MFSPIPRSAACSVCYTAATQNPVTACSLGGCLGALNLPAELFCVLLQQETRCQLLEDSKTISDARYHFLLVLN